MKNKSKALFIINILLSICMAYLLIKITPHIEIKSEYRDLILGVFVILCFFIKFLGFEMLIKKIEEISKIKEFAKSLNIVLFLIIANIDQTDFSLTAITILACIIDFIMNIELISNLLKTKQMNI